MQSQVGLRKHHYEQSWWRWWNSSWTISNPKRWCCESAAFNMLANLENSAVATGLEKVSFHSNPEERQCQIMFKLLHNYTHLTCSQLSEGSTGAGRTHFSGDPATQPVSWSSSPHRPLCAVWVSLPHAATVASPPWAVLESKHKPRSLRRHILSIVPCSIHFKWVRNPG